MAQVHLNRELVLPDLSYEMPQRCFIAVAWGAKRQLLPELLGDPPLLPNGGLIVQCRIVFMGSQRLPKLVGGRDVHADQEAALFACSALPRIDMARKLTPSAEIEVPDAEIGALGNGEGLFE